MKTVRLDHPADFAGWRAGARPALEAGLSVRDVRFLVGDEPGDLFAGADTAAPKIREVRVPKDFLSLAARAICHRDEGKFALLYNLIDRLQSEKHLLKDRADPQVHRLNVLAKEVARDKHKMTAFVRFRKIEGVEPEHYVAWFEPSQYCLDYTAPFFMRRFTGMCWSIITPDRAAHWDQKALTFGPGARKADVPQSDALEDYWRTYYASIFNPARVKLKAMQAEMPKKYWKNLPEAELIEGLTRTSGARVEAMLENAPKFEILVAPMEAAAPLMQPAQSLADLNAQLQACSACGLCKAATQVVPGEGPPRARLMIVGEQPGDREDLAGRPFVGPAGQVLEDALAQAAINRTDVYLTNAVKHFKYEMRGKRRLHQRPDMSEIDHCRWWLGQEIALVSPQVVVALGATAQTALLRRKDPIGDARQKPAQLKMGAEVAVTYHPSAVLRARSAQDKAKLFDALVDDLVAASAALQSNAA